MYLQQDAFDPVDGASSAERQRHVFAVVARILEAALEFADKDAARSFFQTLTQATRDWNRTEMGDEAFAVAEERVSTLLEEVSAHA